MRLFRFINEQDDYLECNKIVAFYNDHIKLKLWRGTKSDYTPNKIVPRTNRNPADSPDWLHRLFDAGFTKAFGKPLRSCSVFCTGNKTNTYIYGKPYIVYPSNDFEVYWSPNILDLYSVECSTYSYSDDELYAALVVCESSKSDMYEEFELNLMNFSDYMKLNAFLEKKFPVELKSVKELPHSRKKFYDMGQAVLKKYPNCINTFVKKNYTSGQLENAIKSGNEIMLTCSYYYLQPSK